MQYKQTVLNELEKLSQAVVTLNNMIERNLAQVPQQLHKIKEIKAYIEKLQNLIEHEK